MSSCSQGRLFRTALQKLPLELKDASDAAGMEDAGLLLVIPRSPFEELGLPLQSVHTDTPGHGIGLDGIGTVVAGSITDVIVGSGDCWCEGFESSRDTHERGSRRSREIDEGPEHCGDFFISCC